MAPNPTEQEKSPFTPVIVRGLGDKLYDKRKAAALEVERLIRDAIAAADHGRVSLLLRALIDEFAYSSLPNHRNGGLIALAAAAIALGTNELPRHLDAIVPPILSCFTDQDARVRYYACESMYNVAKVARGDILKYFNGIFDALSKLSSDSEPSVKNGAELLDRLMKDVVSERSTYWAPPAGDGTVHAPTTIAVDQAATSVALKDPPPPYLAVPGSVPPVPGMKSNQFNLPLFIPLLAERVHTLAPFTRTFLVQWISVLDAVPDLELIAYLPAFLDGLFNYLSDPNIDVRVATLNVLGEFLKEIRDVVETQRERGCLKIQGRQTSAPGSPALRRNPLTNTDSQTHNSLLTDQDHGDVAETQSAKSVVLTEEPPASARPGSGSGHAGSYSVSQPIIHTPVETQVTAESVPDTSGDGEPYVPGLGVVLDIGRMTDILIPHLMSTDEETQATALRWINEFILLAREVMLPFTPLLLDAILPSLAHSVGAIRSIALEANTNLYRLILDLPSVPSLAGSEDPNNAFSATQTSSDISASSVDENSERTATAIVDLNAIDLSTTVETLTLQFQDEHEETRVAALEWLLMLHKRAPKRVLSSDDATFQALLRTLSDSSEEVVKRDLQLLAQVSHHSDDEYFTRFMVNLLILFSSDRRLLETRGSLIIRQLCLSLHPERMYRTFGEILEREDDLEFASTMVQNLNFILITAPELVDLRRRLRNLDSKDGILLFTALYRSWCHNAVAVFSLCLLAQAYEHASALLMLFADLDITVNLLIQIDKLVQLLESPVFTYLRLQLLEPDKHPHLLKCLYGILMLLPQSSAFATLRNRLNSVSNMAFVFSDTANQVDPQSRTGAPGKLSRGKSSSDTSQQVKWSDLLQQFRSMQGRHERARRTGGRGSMSSLDRTSSKSRRSRTLRSEDVNNIDDTSAPVGAAEPTKSSTRERAGSFASSSTARVKRTVPGGSPQSPSSDAARLRKSSSMSSKK
ncbi:vacuolar protein 14 C-terminal Fig4p binding-domain-containing protein [Gaertneriomyces semiglobifer]|nr:vacuolar protein 14 C-terminal Fig4p binding-domain-containing protein [Gaertneriomyces semiglobifer]